MKLDDILTEAKVYTTPDSKWHYWYDGVWRAYNSLEDVEYNAYHREEIAMLIRSHGPEYDHDKKAGGYPPNHRVKPLTSEQIQKVLG